MVLHLGAVAASGNAFGGLCHLRFQTKKMEPFRGVDPHTGEHIMSVCAPLLLDDQVVGAMRYVTALLEKYSLAWAARVFSPSSIML